MFVQKFKKLLNLNVYIITNKRFKWSREDYKYFSRLFSMTSEEAKKYRFHQKLPELTKTELEKRATLFNRLGISTSDWLKYPVLFKESRVMLEQRYEQLHEAGFNFIDAKILTNYESCRRKKIKLLKVYGFINEQTNVAENFLSQLNLTEEKISINDFTEDHSLEYIYHKILTRYLSVRFNTTEYEIEKFFRINSFKALKSLKHVRENLDLLQEIGYTPSEIIKHGFLLKFPPSHLRDTLQIPQFAGMDTRTALKLHPRIIGKPASHYLEIYYILKDAKIPDECIQCDMDVFLMDPVQLKIVVDEIVRVPEMHVLLSSPGIIKVIRGHDEARSRLAFLLDGNFKCLTNGILTKSSQAFDSQIRAGHDTTNRKELVALLQKLLDSNSHSIQINIAKHPFHLFVSLQEVEDSLDYLQQVLKFTNAAIMDAIQIVLYSRQKIMEAKKAVSKLKRSKLTPAQRLNLMMYFLEKDQHFSGNGIWRGEVPR